MPASPTPAQSAASRANGALAAAPPPPGKARSARTPPATACAAPSRLPPEDAAELGASAPPSPPASPPPTPPRGTGSARLPSRLAAQRLQAVTPRARAAEAARTNPTGPRLPSLATLARYRARVERDQRRPAGLEAARRPARACPSASPRQPGPAPLARRPDRGGPGRPRARSDTPNPSGTPPAESERPRRPPLPRPSTASSAAGSTRWVEGRPRRRSARLVGRLSAWSCPRVTEKTAQRELWAGLSYQ